MNDEDRFLNSFASTQPYKDSFSLVDWLSTIFFVQYKMHDRSTDRHLRFLGTSEVKV